MFGDRVIFILQIEWPSEDMRADRKAYVRVVVPANYQVIARRLQEMQFHKWEVCIGTCMRDYLSPAILYFLYRVLRELVFAHPSSNHPNSLKQIFQSSTRYQLLRFAPFNKSRRERKKFTSLYRRDRDIFDRFLIAPDFPNIFLREQSTRTNHPERRIELRISSVEEKKKKKKKNLDFLSQ